MTTNPTMLGSASAMAMASLAAKLPHYHTTLF
jgi:hypothetical protein